MNHNFSISAALAVCLTLCGPNPLRADDFSSNIVIELFDSNGVPVGEGARVSLTVSGRITVTNSVAQHAQFYKNFRVLSANEPGHMIDSDQWVRTFTLDTSEFYDGENLLSVHVHPMNEPGQPYIADFSVQAFKLVTENANPAPNGDLHLPTMVIDPTMISLPQSHLPGGRTLYTDFDAVTVFDEGVKIDVDQQEHQSNTAQVIPHLGTSILGRFRWTDRTLPFGDSVGRLIRAANLLNFQTETAKPARIIFFFSDACGRANYGFHRFTLPALPATTRYIYPLPSTDAKILNVSQGDEIVIPDEGSFTIRIEITNPTLLGRDFTTLSLWVGNRSVAATDLTRLIGTVDSETPLTVDVAIPASEIQKLQQSREGGADATAFALWVDFDRFRESSLPVSEHLHLSSIRTTSYPWPYGNPVVSTLPEHVEDSVGLQP